MRSRWVRIECDEVIGAKTDTNPQGGLHSLSSNTLISESHDLHPSIWKCQMMGYQVEPLGRI